MSTSCILQRRCLIIGYHNHPLSLARCVGVSHTHSYKLSHVFILSFTTHQCTTSICGWCHNLITVILFLLVSPVLPFNCLSLSLPILLWSEVTSHLHLEPDQLHNTSCYAFEFKFNVHHLLVRSPAHYLCMPHSNHVIKIIVVVSKPPNTHLLCSFCPCVMVLLI